MPRDERTAFDDMLPDPIVPGRPEPNRHDKECAFVAFDPRQLTVRAWLEKEITAPEFALGELLSTTSRAELIAPTGLGKTNFTMALGFAIANGSPFLHWRAAEGPH